MLVVGRRVCFQNEPFPAIAAFYRADFGIYLQPDARVAHAYATVTRDTCAGDFFNLWCVARHVARPSFGPRSATSYARMARRYKRCASLYAPQSLSWP